MWFQPTGLYQNEHTLAGSRLPSHCGKSFIFDSSMLVPVFRGDRVRHRASLNLFVQFNKSTGCCGPHSLVEVYSTLTRMHRKHRISGEQAMLFIGSIRERLSVICAQRR